MRFFLTKELSFPYEYVLVTLMVVIEKDGQDGISEFHVILCSLLHDMLAFCNRCCYRFKVKILRKSKLPLIYCSFLAMTRSAFFRA